MNDVEPAVAAIRAGELVVIPTDTVYGLACTPDDEKAVRVLSELKARAADQPIALVASSIDALLECVPELHGQAAALAQVLLPGPYTLVLPNSARRYPWLTGARPDTIGVRVPELAGRPRAILAEVGVVAATSANFHSGADPRSLADIPRKILDSVAVAVDGGLLPGVPSTVLDLTGPEPCVLREGAVPSADALARVASAVAR